jgi:hypothetical protein
MVASEMHLLFQQMGEVLSGIRGLHETIDIRQAQAEQLYDLLRADLSTLRRDQRELEEKVDCMVCIVQNDVQALRGNTHDTARSLGALMLAVESLKRPLLEITALKSRVAGLFFGASVLGSIALWLAEPVYRWFVELKLSPR